ncbi:hypothetical protein Areg01_87140 [Actinoplanes regularis]|nr:hypothetical protein Areg01_87140 [Actinoplanes regularis]
MSHGPQLDVAAVLVPPAEASAGLAPIVIPAMSPMPIINARVMVSMFLPSFDEMLTEMSKP